MFSWELPKRLLNKTGGKFFEKKNKRGEALIRDPVVGVA